MMMRFIIPVLLLLVLGTGAMAYAQTTGGSAGSSALKGFDTEQPIDVEADRLEVNDKDGTAFLSGNVKILQGDMTLFTESLTIYFNRTSNSDTPEIVRIDALTDLRIVSPSETVTGNWAVYDVQRRLITLGGDVDLVRKDANLTGSLLQINLIDGVTTLDRAPVEEGSSGRVKGRFLAPPTGKKPAPGGDK